MLEANFNIVDVLDAFPFYVMLIDENHYILEANKAVYNELGVKREAILGHYCPKVIHQMDKPFPGCPLEDAANANQAVERELHDPITGHWVISAIYPTRILTLDNKRVFLHMVTDVTDRKHAQDQLKISYEQLRNLSAHLESVREEEKRQIARDLHDETSQLLASLYVHLEAAIGTLSKDVPKAENLLRKAQSLSTTILDEIHKLIYELRPSLLDEMGLVPAIDSLVENSLEVTGIQVSLKTTGNIKRLSPQTETALFRVIQEALNNIIKHARASRAIVILNFGKKKLKVKISDNGAGFNVQEALNPGGSPRGLGLLGMQERMILIQGSLNIQSTPGKGTEIRVEVPLENNNPKK